jgi:hypothetical protein
MGFREDFMQYLCGQTVILYTLHIMSWVGVILNTMSLFVVGPGGRAVVLLNYIGLAAFIGGTGFVIWRCWKISPAPSPVDNV